MLTLNLSTCASPISPLCYTNRKMVLQVPLSFMVT
uniref:Uncharacterized protein n=1 Tax=Anguilla anguilla TaxID=7936 RepID=A0A0E9SFY5_ANGAN